MSLSFVIVRILFPYIITTQDQIVYTSGTCRNMEEEGPETACPSMVLLTIKQSFVLYTLFLIVCDVMEVWRVMIVWNAAAASGRAAGGQVVLNQHKKFVAEFMKRLLYGAILVAWYMKSYDSLKMAFNLAFSEFNDTYCSGPGREPHLCYKYNQEKKKGRSVLI